MKEIFRVLLSLIKTRIIIADRELMVALATIISNDKTLTISNIKLNLTLLSSNNKMSTTT
jgi:hypothetical protein